MDAIVWITPRCFVETDIYAIKNLSGRFHITWIIVEETKCSEYNEMITSLNGNEGIVIEKAYLPARNRSIRTLVFYSRLLKYVKTLRPQLIYNPIFGMPFYMPLQAIILGRKKVVVAIHNVTTPIGSKAPTLLSKLYTRFTYSYFKNIHTLSRAQCLILQNIVPSHNVFFIPFLLKDYGFSSITPSEIPTFLFFGQILEYKRLDILIKAAQSVYEKTGKKFLVKIAGSCVNWVEKYQTIIKHPSLFDLIIRRIDNSEIPGLFASSHYFVMPYQDIAQSGAMIVAINYELPVIASKLPAFEELISDGINGHLITPASSEDLERVLENILLDFERNYKKDKEGMVNLKKDCFDSKRISNQYFEQFTRIINNNNQ